MQIFCVIRIVLSFSLANVVWQKLLFTKIMKENGMASSKRGFPSKDKFF